MRSLRRMFAHRAARLEPARMPASLSQAERAEREAASQRLERKWAHLDRLVQDFRRGDGRLRLR